MHIPNTTYPNAANWSPLQAKTTNITIGGIKQKVTGFTAGLIGSLTGIPLVGQIGQSLTDASANYSVKSAYAVSSLQAMKSTDNIGIMFPDFRARKFGEDPTALVLQLHQELCLLKKLMEADFKIQFDLQHTQQLQFHH